MNLLNHEILFSQAIMKLWPYRWRRGKRVNPETRADGDLEIQTPNGPLTIYFEYVTGSQSNRQLKARARVYERRDDFVVWIAPDHERLDRVKWHCCGIVRAQFMLAGSDVMIDRDGDESTVDQLCGSSGEDVLQP